jgi:Protein of unknown function (DUF2865)
MTASLNNKRLLFSLLATDPRSMFRSSAALISIAAAALVLASTGLISRQANQSSTELPAIAISDPVIPPQLKTTGETLINADSFDLIFRGSLRDDELALTPGFDIPHRNDGRSGFYFPVSFATRRQRFARDAKQCEQSCPSRARLFVHRNPGEKADDMVDLAGRPYRKLPTAFLHRTDRARCGLHLPCTSMASGSASQASCLRGNSQSENCWQHPINPSLTQTERGPGGKDRWARPLPVGPWGGACSSPGSASALVQGSQPMISDLGSPHPRSRFPFGRPDVRRRILGIFRVWLAHDSPRFHSRGLQHAVPPAQGSRTQHPVRHV